MKCNCSVQSIKDGIEEHGSWYLVLFLMLYIPAIAGVIFAKTWFIVEVLRYLGVDI